MRPDDERRDAGFSIFYMGINIGGLLAPLVTGFLAQSDTFKGWLSAGGFDPADSWHWGFGAAGVGMTLGLIVYMLQAKRLAACRARARRGAPAHGRRACSSSSAPWRSWRSPCCRTIRASNGCARAFLLMPVAAIVWFAMRGDLDGQRLAAVFVFFIAAMIFWAIFEQAGITIALFGLELTRTAPAAGPSPPRGFSRSTRCSSSCWRRCSPSPGCGSGSISRRAR